MKQLPKAIDRNGDLWVPAVTKNLLYRALQDARRALESSQGLAVTQGSTVRTIDHAEQLQALAVAAALLGLDRCDRSLPPVHEQLGEPTARQTQVLRNLTTLRSI